MNDERPKSRVRTPSNRPVKPMGFLSERTCEYVLAPELSSMLRAHFALAVPFFFWSSREGASHSRGSGPSALVRLVAAFARRPKLCGPGDRLVRIRINEELFAFAQISRRYGVPVLAGVPLVRSLFEIEPRTRCLWYRFDGERVAGEETDFEVDPDGDLAPSGPVPAGLRGPLQRADIARVLERHAAQMSWRDALGSIREARRDADAHRPRMWFTAGYRPFYVVVGT